MLTEETIKKFTGIVTKVDTYAEKNNITAKKACEKMGIKPFDYYTFKSKLKRAATPQVVTYSAKTTKLIAKKPKKFATAQTLTVIIGSPDEVMMVLKGLQS